MLSKELVAACSRPLVLTLLNESESYGYDLIRRVREISGGQLEWTEGTLYPVLHRLERERLISSTWREGENGRRRKYYALTARGRASLATEKNDWLTVHHLLDTLWKPHPTPRFASR